MHLVHLLWNNNDNHDKIWGAISLEDDDHWQVFTTTYVIFWGKRGAKLRTKITSMDGFQLDNLVDDKLDNGYQLHLQDELDTVHPDLKKQLEKIYFLSMLKK